MKIGATDAILLATSGLSIDNIRELSNMDTPNITVSNVKDLVKQGYKFEEVKELLTYSTNEPEYESGNSPEEGGNNGGPTEQPEAPAETVDYKALYEESQRQLATAQQLNTSANLKPDQEGPTDQELLNSWAQSIM